MSYDRVFDDGQTVVVSRATGEVVDEPGAALERIDGPTFRGNFDPREYADGGPPGGVAGADNESYGSAYDFLYTDDPNPLWQSRQRYRVIDEMRKSDASVRGNLLLYKLPIRAAKWRVDPASKDGIDKLIAEAVAWQFGIGEQEDDGPLSATFDSVLDQSLKVLDFGSMHEEIVWADTLRDWTDTEGQVHTLQTVQRLAPRSPRTVSRIQTDPRTGRIVVLEQWLPQAKPIPAAKLVSHVIDSDDGDWYGTSMCRPMWGSWKLKKQLMIASGIGWDRFASGIPVVYHPSGETNKRRAGEIGRTVRQNERGYVTFEGRKDTSEWSLDLVNGAGTLADPVPLLRFYCEQIAAAGLAFFTSLGTSQTGSRAVGEVLIDPFFDAVTAVAGQLAATYQRTIVRQFVDFNFGTTVRTPRISAGNIGARDIAVLCQAIYDLNGAGMDFSDTETADAIRDVLNLPPTPKDENGDPIKPEGSPPPRAALDPLTGLPVVTPPVLPPAAPRPVPALAAGR